jgi:hypothetical protein
MPHGKTSKILKLGTRRSEKTLKLKEKKSTR